MGRCPDCGQWNSFVEEAPVSGAAKRKAAEPVPLDSITHTEESRLSTGIGELDRVLGGGVVPGSVVLIGGDPGIGKSTLTLQALGCLSGMGKVLYVSGEESPEQVKLRAERLGIRSENIILLPETSLEGILRSAEKLTPRIMVVDSIQTIFFSELPSAPGSVGQIRECATRLMFYAKKLGVPLFIIGHVTKEGAIAGPKVLEHIVDTVLYFEGDNGQPFRILRAVKNRFGSTNEIGVFEMSDRGLVEIDNPSMMFLSERPENVPGSVVTVSIEGTRPLLVEIQALTTPTNFGVPRRTATGVDYNRINLLVAVLEKRLGMQLGGMDIYVNVTGGLKIEEPAVDMGIVAAIVSSFRNQPVSSGLFTFGEVGLSGEIRAVSRAEDRIREAMKLGFGKGVVPAGSLQAAGEISDIIGVRNVEEAVDILLF
jgi:DNA repair protein RadA/Sms